MAKKLLFVFNPKAGIARSRAPLFDAMSVFCDAGYEVTIYHTTCRGDATETVATIGKDYDLVVCSGGDGTLNETITGLMQLEERPLLGYLPRGTTNDFASSLNISAHPVKAAKTLMQHHLQVLDVGQWADRYFVYVASFGAFTKTSYSAPQISKNTLGHFAYILEGMRDLDSLRPYAIQMIADGEDLSGSYLFGAICNSTSIGGMMKLNPENVVLDDGKFEMLLIPNPKTAQDLHNLIAAMLNQEYDREGLIFRHVSHVSLATQETLPWSLDGEFAPSRSSVEINNRHNALRMLL